MIMKKSNLEKIYSKQIYDILLKRLTLPLIIVVITFSVALVGLTLIPGEIVDGVENKLSFSEAFYFVLYTATTIGYGEIVHFSYLQQLWVVFTIIFTVISWFYILSTIVGLMTNEYFIGIKETRRSLIRIKNIREEIVVFVGYSTTYYRLIKKLIENNNRKIIIVIEDKELYKREQLKYLRENDIVFLNIKLVSEDLLDAINITSNKITNIILTEEIDNKFKLGVLIRSANNIVKIITTIKDEYEENIMKSLKIKHLINGRKYIGEDVFQLLNNQKIAELSEWIHGDLEKSDFITTNTNQKKILIIGAGNISLNILELTKDEEKYELLIIDKDKDLLNEVVNKYGEVKIICANVLDTDLWNKIDMDYFNYAFIGTNDDYINMYLCNMVNELNEEMEIIVKINKRENEYLLTAENIIKKINLEEIENIDIYNTIDKYELIYYKKKLLSKDKSYLNKYSAYIEKNLLTSRIEELEINSNEAIAILNKIKTEDIQYNFLLMDLENIDDGYNGIIPLFIKRLDGTHVLIDVFEDNYEDTLTYKIEAGDKILYVAKNEHSKYKFEFLLENETELNFALSNFKKS